MVKIHASLDHEPASLLKDIPVDRQLLRCDPKLHADTVRIVRQRDRKDRLPGLQLPLLDQENLAANHHLARLLAEGVHRNRRFLEAAPENHVRILRYEGFRLARAFFLRRELLLLLWSLLAFFRAAHDRRYVVFDPRRVLGEERGMVGIDVDRRHGAARESRPLGKYLLEVRKELSGAFREDRIDRDPRLDLVLRGKYELRALKKEREQRADRFQLRQHARAVDLVEILRVVLRGQGKPLHQAHLRAAPGKDLSGDGLLRLVDRLLLDPVLALNIEAVAVFLLASDDPDNANLVEKLPDIFRELQRREYFKKTSLLSCHSITSPKTPPDKNRFWSHGDQKRRRFAMKSPYGRWQNAGQRQAIILWFIHRLIYVTGPCQTATRS